MSIARPRVLVADDHPEVSKAVCRLLELDFEIVGTIADGRALLEAVQRLEPEVVVLDVNLPGVHGTGGVSSADTDVPGDESRRVLGDERAGSP